MFRSLLSKSGATLKRKTVIINGESSSSSLAAKYFLFTFQNQNVGVISNSRVTSIFYSLYTTTSSDSSFVVSYLITSCGLSESQAITASKKINFKTSSKPDSVLALLRSYGLIDSHILKLINIYPSILSKKPDKTLKPRFDFLISKGLYGTELANFISKEPLILSRGFINETIPSFDILKSIVQSDQNVIKLLKRNYQMFRSFHVKRVMVNLELLRNQGVPEPNISKFLINQPRTFTGDAAKFRKIVEKVKNMGFDHSQTAFLRAIVVFTQISEVNWSNKMDVYKRWGWSEDHIPGCMTASEKKIMAVMNFLVNEMGHESLSIAKYPLITKCSLKGRIIPRCSVIRVLVSRGLIKENISLTTVCAMKDESFVEKFVKNYEEEVPELMKIFQGQLNYQQMLQN